MKMKTYFDKFNKNMPANIEQINKISKTSGLKFPQEYTDILLQSNGGEGMVGPNSYLILFSVDELLIMNKAYKVENYAPGIFIFGSDGGGEAYAFKTKDAMRIVRIPFVGMDLSAVEFLADTFTAFMQYLANQ